MSSGTRVNVSKEAPAVYEAMTALAGATREYLATSGLQLEAAELIKIRVSQINGCAFCLKMHTETALRAGERPDRLAVLPAWRESESFSAHERAALDIAEAVTRVADGQVPDEVYDRVAAVLSPSELTAAVWMAVTMNSFNRLAITSRYAA
jgi:AhpD family alkylhydroperoxidase